MVNTIISSLATCIQTAFTWFTQLCYSPSAPFIGVFGLFLAAFFNYQFYRFLIRPAFGGCIGADPLRFAGREVRSHQTHSNPNVSGYIQG